jgi:hypothetical protein
MRKRRENESTSLSFLDCICCGFGGIILLLVITKMFEPVRLSEEIEQSTESLTLIETQLDDVVRMIQSLQEERADLENLIMNQEDETERINTRLAQITTEFSENEATARILSDTAGQLAQARQTLSDEMALLSERQEFIQNNVIGGIPVDSEYIIFIIDTSGSMRRYAWSRVEQQIRETLEIYPEIQGIQVLNDMGDYLFRSYRNEWIPDTPGGRESIINALRSWNSFSNSSPQEGIIEAVSTFYDPEKRISIYVYSDDFSSGSINSVVQEVARRNQSNSEGLPLVRIHAVAFPVYFEVTGGELLTAARFAVLMRELCQRNGGTFVALPSI